MSGDDSRPGLRAPARETVFRPFPLASPSGPLYIERMFLLQLCINQSIYCLHLYRSLYSNMRCAATSTRYMCIAGPESIARQYQLSRPCVDDNIP